MTIFWMRLFPFVLLLKVTYCAQNHHTTFERSTSKSNFKDQVSNETGRGLKTFSIILKALSLCTDTAPAVLHDTLSVLLTCTTYIWQRCLHMQTHELVSHQMALNTTFPCHHGYFDVSHLRSLHYSIHTLSFFQVCKFWRFQIFCHRSQIFLINSWI